MEYFIRNQRGLHRAVEEKQIKFSGLDVCAEERKKHKFRGGGLDLRLCRLHNSLSSTSFQPPTSTSVANAHPLITLSLSLYLYPNSVRLSNLPIHNQQTFPLQPSIIINHGPAIATILINTVSKSLVRKPQKEKSQTPFPRQQQR